MKKVNLILIRLLIVVGLVVVAGCSSVGKTGDLVSGQIVVYKSSSCGCCNEYVPELRRQGFDIKVNELQDLTQIKQQYNIPKNMESCHTTIIMDYFVEGHVPIEAVNKLLEEKPNIDGIALPGMPSGSPGMPGAKKETWTIYAIKNGEISEFMVL